MTENNSKVELMNFNAFLPNPITTPEIIDRKWGGKGFIYWGENNTLPQFLWDNYLKCSDLQTLINRTVDYVKGDSIDVVKQETILTNEDSFQDLVDKIIFDYVLFGGFALEGIRNANGEIVRLNYINVMNVRVDEDLTTAYICVKNSGRYAKYDVTLPLFKRDEKQPHFIFYYRGAITRNINPVPIWFSALKSVQVLNETREYNLRNIQNNFSANVIVALNGTSIKQRELQEIKDKMELGYTGSENAGKTLFINNANSEGKVEITRLDADKASDLYKNVQESSQKDMQMAFAMNPILIGVNVQTGFSKQEFSQAYALFMSTVAQPLRNNIIKQFNKLGVGLVFNDFKINWSEE